MFIINFYKNLLIEHWVWIKKILTIAGVFLVIGLITPFIFPQVTQLFLSSLAQFFEQLAEQAGGGLGTSHPNLSLAWVILKQNLRVAILGLFLGVLLGIIPFFTTSFNFFVIGLFFSSIAKKNILAAFIFIFALLPHGIFEIPALLISAAFGIKLGLFWKLKSPHLNLKQKFLLALKQNIQIAPIITILLIIAAFTEVFVSTRVTHSFSSKLDGIINSLTTTTTTTVQEEFHIHADFKVFINNKPIDFSLNKYQSNTTSAHDAFAHLHDGNGEVMHIHKEGITLGYFFETLGMEFTEECFKLDTGKKYCNTRDKFNTVHLWVNGRPNSEFENYKVQDLDRILITYGHLAGSQLPDQFDMVTDAACVYSKTCPERGEPPTEGCVKALGVPCK